MTTVISSARRAPCTGSRGQSSSDQKTGGDYSRCGMSFQLDPELVGSLTADVRFTPKSGHTSRCPICANSGHRWLIETPLVQLILRAGGE